MSVISLLISCSTPKPKVEICARDICAIAGKFAASTQDKAILKQSNVSKEFIKQFVDYNDLWEETCKGLTPTLTNIPNEVPASDPTIRKN